MHLLQGTSLLTLILMAGASVVLRVLWGNHSFICPTPPLYGGCFGNPGIRVPGSAKNACRQVKIRCILFRNVLIIRFILFLLP
ncbi:hypothetical protein CW304_23265 [Bacillus sp. UFRGS-B20]|nr:hypothetical protein CW304_23265 [Bacillus sp. UFRGS-B20]